LTAGEVHKKLASFENFPETYKKKLMDSGEEAEWSGDLREDNKKVIKLLKGTSKSQLSSGRAADFKGEVKWRMQLRS
jgi:hypothetical protein